MLSWPCSDSFLVVLYAEVRQHIEVQSFNVFLFGFTTLYVH